MNILDMVGNTPLLELNKITLRKGIDITGGNGTFSQASGHGKVKLFAKAEFCNPSGSVKDRAAKAMILDGMKNGKLTPGKTLIDASSGNTGIAYAMFGAALGFPVTIYLPANASSERKNIIRHYGAKIVETSAMEGSDGSYFAAHEEVEAHPDNYFYPDQYHNDENWRAHYNSTGKEIWEQTENHITHFICGMGTSGTFTGTSRRLKDYNGGINVIAVQPDSPFHGIEGTKHMASTVRPGFYDEKLPDSIMEVNTENAYGIARRLAREEGLYVGVSSAANVLAALQLAQNLEQDAVIVTILCDGGIRYVSDSFWEAQ
jgi:cysteine synthase B